MNDRPKLTAADFAIAEEVIGAWCENGDKKHTRDLIAEGAARARIATAGKIPTDALAGAWDDVIRTADQVAAASRKV